jgi:DNA-binding beta-propeller fold protein YncE
MSCRYYYILDLRVCDGKFPHMKTMEFITWGSYGSGNGQFLNPSDFDIDHQGNIYVLDTKNKEGYVQKFDINGNFLKKWGKSSGWFSGGKDGKIKSPQHVRFDPSYHNILVTDQERENCISIHKFSLEGEFVEKWEFEPKHFDLPKLHQPRIDGIEIIGPIFLFLNPHKIVSIIHDDDPMSAIVGLKIPLLPKFSESVKSFTVSEGLFVASNKKVLRYDIDNGSIVAEWNLPIGPDKVNVKKILNPLAEDDLFVATDNNVLRFNSEGEIVVKYIIDKDSKNAELKDISLDFHNNLYVSVDNPSKILRYDHDGKLNLEIGKSGTKIGEFNNPAKIRIDDSENLIVLDKGNSRMCKIFGLT